MKIQQKHIAQGLISLFAATLISGCANTQTSRLYILHSPSDITSISKEIKPISGLHIAVERIRIPKYLERPTVITTAKDSELVYSEFQRWASPLENNLSEVLILNLGQLLPECVIKSSRVMVPTPPDYQLNVQIQRLTGELGKDANLMARWTIFSNAGGIKHYQSGGTSTHETTLEGTGYDVYVSAVNKLLLELSINIAKDLSTIKKTPTVDTTELRGDESSE
jgi:uncharacterized lipoprotein YmbA